MAEVVARVGKVTGEAFARDADGNLRRIKSGDPIREGEVVQAGAGGEVQLKLVDGRDLVVRANEAAKLDAEVAAPERPDAGDSAVLNNPSGFAKISKAIVGPDGTFSFDDDGGRGLNPVYKKRGILLLNSRASSNWSIHLSSSLVRVAASPWTKFAGAGFTLRQRQYSRSRLPRQKIFRCPVTRIARSGSTSRAVTRMESSPGM